MKENLKYSSDMENKKKMTLLIKKIETTECLNYYVLCNMISEEIRIRPSIQWSLELL